MKKMLFLFIVVMLLSITGCSNPIDEESSTQPEIELKSSNVTEMSVDLSWTEIDDAYQYAIFVSDTANEEGKIVFSTPENSFTLEPLLPNKTYYITVKENHDDSESHFGKISNAISISTKVATLSIPTNIVSNNNSFQIKFSWDDVVDKYNVYRSKSLDGEYLLLAWGKLDKAEYEDMIELEPDTEIYYKIQAVDSINKKSSDLTPVFLSKTSPADYDLAEISTFIEKAYGLSLSWVDNNVEYDINVNCSSSSCCFVSPTLVDVTDLLPDSDYIVSIRAINYDTGESSCTLSRAFKTNSATLSVPQGLSVTDTTNNSISVSWDAVADADTYQIQYSKFENFLYESWSGTTVNTNKTIEHLDPDTTYYFKVRAINITTGECSNLTQVCTIFIKKKFFYENIAETRLK